MTEGRRVDLAYSTVMLIALVLYASASGGTLYAGFWYPVAIPLLIVVWCLILGTPAYFLTGTTAATVVTLLIYINIISTTEHPDGLLVLGHLFSIPGMLMGIGIAAWALKHRLTATLPWIVASIGFVGAALGFLAAQLIVCNSLMYCSVLSWGA